jgi:hypothetical protein
MRPLNLPKNGTIRPEVWREKLAFGVSYGAAAGLAFAGVTWGWDAIQLYRANALFPWLKLVFGLAACGLIGSLTGWLVMRFDKSLAAFLFWLVAALVFAWMVTALPLQIAPRIATWLEPDLKGLLDYVYYDEFSSRTGVAYAWVGIFTAIIGLLQLPLSDSGVFSTSRLGRAAPALACILIMGMNGMFVDGLNNGPLRSGLLSVNETIQFAVDHQNETVDQKESLRMHLGSLRMIREYINRPRKLIVGGFDEFLTEVNVLVRFGDVWVNCISIYNQPSNCTIVRP